MQRTTSTNVFLPIMTQDAQSPEEIDDDMTLGSEPRSDDEEPTESDMEFVDDRPDSELTVESDSEEEKEPKKRKPSKRRRLNKLEVSVEELFFNIDVLYNECKALRTQVDALVSTTVRIPRAGLVPTTNANV